MSLDYRLGTTTATTHISQLPPFFKGILPTSLTETYIFIRCNSLIVIWCKKTTLHRLTRRKWLMTPWIVIKRRLFALHSAAQWLRLGKRELIIVLFVSLFDLHLFGFVCFLFLLVSWKGCVLWLWHSLDLSLTFVCCRIKHNSLPLHICVPFIS